MLFAAGLGTRMRPLTDDRPKPLIPVAGRALVDHARAQAGDLRLKTVANAHYLADQVQAHFAGTDVTVLSEAPQILDTGGGLRQALPVLGDGPVFTLNTDAVWKGPAALPLLARAWDPARMDALLLCVPRDQARGHLGQGDFLADDTGRATPGPGAIYTGAQIVDPRLMDGIPGPAFSMWELWRRALARERLYLLSYPGLWCDVGRPDCLPLAEAMLADD
ncbi:nucleotidyltransferase family protein [Pseudooceanicola sp. 200-1SW]|uniref:nucleotidyltransferase family protein n=1 Tax=Pseudooceanicola sp. 200-1SW TaxID=3425949 RepID=UPI003D7FAB95